MTGRAGPGVGREAADGASADPGRVMGRGGVAGGSGRCETGQLEVSLSSVSASSATFGTNNCRRRHSAPGYLSLVEYEARMAIPA